MKAVFLRGATLLVAASLAACTTTGDGGGMGPGADVTRFHLGQPIARGPIAIEPFQAEQANSIEFRTYADAVSRQLTQLGWTVVNTTGQSEQVALVGVAEGPGLSAPRRPPVTIGIGGGTGGWHSGVGAGATFPVGGRRSGEVIMTRLDVSIRRRSDGTVFWEGRAITQAPVRAPDSSGPPAAEKLAGALFQDFPGESGRTIRVR